MKSFTIAVGAGAAAVAVLAGCGPSLAQVPYGEEEARWQKVFRDNYSGYEAPRTAPPAIRDNVSPRLLEEEEARRNAQNRGNVNTPPPADNPPAVDNPQQPADNPPADDPARIVDNAAKRSAAEEPAPPREPERKAAPAKEDKPAAHKGAPKDAGVYEVKPNDTLGGIAKKFYGDARRTDVIIRANPSLKKNPDFLKPGMKLVIPKI